MSPPPEPKQQASPRDSPSPASPPQIQPPAQDPQHMAHDTLPRIQYPTAPEHLYQAAAGPPVPQGIPTEGPATHPDGPPPPPRDYGRYAPPPGIPTPPIHFAPHLPPPPHLQPSTSSTSSQMSPPPPGGQAPPKRSPKSSSDLFLAPNAAELYNHAQGLGLTNNPPNPDAAMTGPGANHYPSANGVTRLPPILQVEKQQVTTSATQMASASRRRNEAHFQCPVPGCGSTFTRRFNLRGHLRSHTEERPYVCEWPGCKKGFARQHDCKRHQALHTAKSQNNICLGCKKTFSRLDALNVRHHSSDPLPRVDANMNASLSFLFQRHREFIPSKA
ncbi:zinc finger and SCAN domain-containing protein 5, variant 2 [Coprinopsis cinerea AmutBmut pab1-1]|nr:zinc finger and SCAN domain-containing protein 5, variant 2 [Coprinopsis cinerea AmutBmut pab1-1]